MIRDLEYEVKKRIEKAVKEIKLTDDKEEYVTPLIEIGAIPKSAVKGRPYILIQTTDISDSILESTVNINILYGTVGASNKAITNEEALNHILTYGHWDVISIIDKVRTNFLSNINFEFGILERTMRHDVLGKVDFPYYLGESKLEFKIPTTAQFDDYV